jgi:hypothetical protein
VIPETFEIFSGSPEKEPLWLESVTGLEAASERMNDRAQHHPGPYFVFCVHTKQVLASTDTSPSGSPQAPLGLAQKA